MKRRLSTVLAIVVALTLVSVAPVSADEPLVGDMELEFNLEFGTGLFPAISWVGTVDFDGDVYGIAFFPTGAKDVGTVHHFWEDWAIYPYDAGDPFFTFTGGVLTEFAPEPPVLEGYDRGTAMKNNRYRMNGSVTGVADPFEEWLGRNVHMSGVIEWYEFGAPHFAPGTFRVN